MIRAQDLLLLAVSFSTMALGVLFPRFGRWFAAAPLYCMMALVFLSMLSISTKSIWQVVRTSRRLIGWLLMVKLVVLPVSVYYLFRWDMRATVCRQPLRQAQKIRRGRLEGTNFSRCYRRRESAHRRRS